jgi:hypothetical protein
MILTKGFTVICNSCGNKVDFNEEKNKRHDLDNKFSVMIHSSIECAFMCWNCEQKVILNDEK